MDNLVSLMRPDRGGEHVVPMSWMGHGTGMGQEACRSRKGRRNKQIDTEAKSGTGESSKF